MIQGTLWLSEEIACPDTAGHDSIPDVITTSGTLPDDIDALKAALLVERTARRELEARALGAEAMVAHLKLQIAKFRRDRFAPSVIRPFNRVRLSSLMCELAAFLNRQMGILG